VTVVTKEREHRHCTGVHQWGALQVIYGLVLAAIYLYHAWQVSNTIQ
jgi:hypothetical protein